MAPQACSLRTRALRYLARREYSRAELFRKLQPYVEEAPSSSLSQSTEGPLSLLLDELEDKGFLSDQRFTNSVLHRRASQFGAQRILNELKQHTLAPTLIEYATDHLRHTESDRLYAVWQKKYGHPPATFQDRIKQARFLASRGFSYEAITALLGQLEQD